MLLKISQSLCLGFGLISSSALFAAAKILRLLRVSALLSTDFTKRLVMCMAFSLSSCWL
jgi:hypothetical protein